jgi:hypothetical protein
VVVLYIISLSVRSGYQEYSVGHADFDSCFDILDDLINAGCELLHVKLSIYNGKPIVLPIEAFDGEPVGEAFRALKDEWEKVLCESR